MELGWKRQVMFGYFGNKGLFFYYVITEEEEGVSKYLQGEA